MFTKKIKYVLAGCLLLLLLSGCGQQKQAQLAVEEPRSDTGRKITIVTSFYPVYLATMNVTKDIPGVEVINMTKPQTGCLHDYQLTPADLKTLEKADVFVVNGAGMERFMEKLINQHAGLKVVEASKGIELIKDESGEVNPHVWVSVSHAMRQVTNIAEQLAAIDGGNADKYRKNAERYKEKLAALRTRMHRELDGIPNREIITFHEAFPYFADEFHLKIAAVIEREPGAEPTPKELEETINTIKTAKIKALFAEPQYPVKAAEAIARETGTKVFTLDPVVTGEAKPEAIDDYITRMEKNLTTLKEALQ